jgi:hypothetical protein
MCVALAGAALGAGAWAGCSNLSGDCELNLDCGSAPSCTDLLGPGDCETCMQQSCCLELGLCNQDNTCLNYCVFGPLPSVAACRTGHTAELFADVGKCWTEHCAVECADTDSCNPVTNGGCPAAEECDTTWPGEFFCVSSTSAGAALCAKCDVFNGPICAGGLHCTGSPGICVRYCCDSGDCGSGTCDTNAAKVFGAALTPGDAVGLCMAADGGDGFACDAPPVAPSNGACVGGFPPDGGPSSDGGGGGGP